MPESYALAGDESVGQLSAWHYGIGGGPFGARCGEPERRHYAFLKASTAFNPPNANEFDSAYSTSAARA